MIEGLVCFSHFIKKLDKLTISDTVEDFIGRGAAGQFMNNEKSLDLFVPVVLKNDDITYIFIQVKNHCAKVPRSDVKNMKPNEIYFKNGIINLNYLSILMSVGFEEKKPIELSSVNYYTKRKATCVNHFKFNGLNAYPFLETKSIKQALKLLLDNDRLDYKLHEKKVFERVFLGSMNYNKCDNFFK